MTETLSPHFGQDAAVRTYRDIHLPRVFEPWAKILLEMAPCAAGEVVLDVATGPGTVARQAALLVGPDGRVTGVDISAAMLGVGRGWPAETGAAPIEYVESSGSSLPLEDQTFDVAYCQQGLQHMSDPHTALREIRRVLKPGGRIGVALWTRSPFGIFRDVVAREGGSDEGPQPSGFGRDAAQLAEAIRAAGFSDVQVQEREMTSVLEGGVPQAIEVAQATSGGAVLARLPEAKRQAIVRALGESLEKLLVDGVVKLPSAANIASARV